MVLVSERSFSGMKSHSPGLAALTAPLTIRLRKASRSNASQAAEIVNPRDYRVHGSVEQRTLLFRGERVPSTLDFVTTSGHRIGSDAKNDGRRLPLDLTNTTRLQAYPAIFWRHS